MEHRILPLWPGTEAPYTADSPGQAQPSLKEYAVPGAPGRAGFGLKQIIP